MRVGIVRFVDRGFVRLLLGFLLAPKLGNLRVNYTLATVLSMPLCSISHNVTVGSILSTDILAVKNHN